MNWNYYLASGFEHLWIIPDGMIHMRNWNKMPVVYAGHVLQEQGIDFPTVRKMGHKLAFDNLTDEKMSENARAQIQRLYLDGLWAQCKRDLVLDKRFANEEEVQAMVDYGYAYGDMLLEKKIVDDFLHSTRAKEKMLKIIGLPDSVISSPKERSKHLINLPTYSKQIRKIQASEITPPFYKKFFFPKPQIVGVVTLSGAINQGSSREGITSQYTEKLIRQAANDEQVKAIVLRIDSGGGSAWASSVIGDVIQETIKGGKPVVASMASVAASGGYWIASPCNAILASPGTITGSIGVLMASPRIHRLLIEKFGINIEYGPGNDSASAHLDSSITPYTREHLLIQDNFATHLYLRFLKWVSETRKIDLSTVEDIAQGKVHTGASAYDLKLVDQLGGLIPALQTASKLGGVTLQKNGLPLVRNFPSTTPLQALLKILSGKSHPKNSEDLSALPGDLEAMMAEYITTSLNADMLKEIAGIAGINLDDLKVTEPSFRLKLPETKM
jgi:protease-4